MALMNNRVGVGTYRMSPEGCHCKLRCPLAAILVRVLSDSDLGKEGHDWRNVAGPIEDLDRAVPLDIEKNKC